MVMYNKEHKRSQIKILKQDKHRKENVMSNITKAIAALGVVAGLGVAALPLSTYADATVPVTAQINSSMAISTSADAVDFGQIIAGGAVATQDLDVTVSTTATSYNLNIKDSDSNTALVSVDETGSAITGENAATIVTGAPKQGTSAWGYKVGETGAWTNITTTNKSIYEGTAAGTSKTTVTFGVSAAAGQKDGTYKGGVIFTATTE